MPSTTSLVEQLKHDFPAITFEPGTSCSWLPTARTIYYRSRGHAADLLHEVAHATLGHTGYTRDISLLEMERDAWQYAKVILAPRYKLTFKQELVDTALDTYRDWLHARSLCPSCEATGLQTDMRTYNCLACGQAWRVNDARSCSLRRYKLANNKNTPQ